MEKVFEWFVIPSSDDDGPIFEIWEKRENSAAYPVGETYKAEYADEIVAAHNKLVKS